MKQLTAKTSFMEKIIPFIGLILLIIVVSILNPSFLDLSNLLNLLRQISINGLIAFGMTFIILTGGIDLSVGSILALSSAFIALMITSGVDPIIALIIGVLIGFVLGAVNGLLVTKGNMAPFIATLATMTIFRGLTLVITDGNPITNLGDSYLFQLFGKGYFIGIPVPAVTMIIVFVILLIILQKTTFGRHTYAIGGNEVAAKISGIKVNKIKILIYGISGLMSALAGGILTSRLNSAQPTAGTSYELDAIAAVVLGGTSLTGGKGRIVGTLIGVLIIGVLNNGLNLLGVSSFYQQVVKGVVILIAVLIDRKNKRKQDNNMKKLLAITLALVLFLAACSLESPLKNDKNGKTNKKKSEITIGVSISTLNNPFFVKIKNGIEKDAKAQGMKVKVVDARDDSAKQTNDIEDLIQQQVDYLIVNPTDSSAISSAVESANNEGIPVITLDRSVDKGDVASFIASDNVEGGKMAGKYLVDKVGKNAKVGELEGVPGASATRERGKGFHEIADKQLKVIAKQSAKFDRAEGLNVTQNMLEAHPNIKAIFAQNDEMALGAIEAIGDKDIQVIGFDGNEDAMKSIKNGKLDATIAQQPELMGKEAIKVVNGLMKGDSVNKQIKVPLKLKQSKN